MLVELNGLVLAVLLVLLVTQEVRHRRLARTVMEKRQALQVLAHQMRTPLSTLRKYHLFLRGDEFGKLSLSQQEALSSIDAAFSETVLLLERLLSRARIEERPLGSASSVDVLHVLQGVLESAEGLILKHGHAVECSSSVKRAMVFCDPLLLHGILDELLTNAILYTSNGGEITILLRSTSTDVLVEIHDNGIGISLQEQQFVFQKYFRGERAKSMSSGNGMGLSFASQFTALSKGSLTFSSEEGRGTTFTLRIPKKS